MKPQAYLIHTTPGRMRLRLPALRHNPPQFAQLADKLSRCAGVERVEANPLSASVLVQHRCEAEEIFRYSRDQNLFEIRDTPPLAQPLTATLTEELGRFNRRLRRYSGGQIDFTSAGLLLLGGLTLYQLRRGRALAPAATLLWYAITLLQSTPATGTTPNE